MNLTPSELQAARRALAALSAPVTPAPPTRPPRVHTRPAVRFMPSLRPPVYRTHGSRCLTAFELIQWQEHGAV